MGGHTLVLPFTFQLSCSHVSMPNSPSRGTVWKVHNNLPLVGSKPRTSPGGEGGNTSPSCTLDPRMRVSLHITPGELLPIWLTMPAKSGASGWSWASDNCMVERFRRGMSSSRSTLPNPESPKPALGSPLIAFSAMSLPSPVGI